MRLDLVRPSHERLSCMYPSHHFEHEGALFEILGADSVQAAALEKYIRQSPGRLDAKRVRDLYLAVPGNYAMLFRRDGEVCVATDPYGIVKLYWFRGSDQSILVDDVYELTDQRFTLDREALKYFMIRRYTPSRHTFFRELAKLEPCTVYVFRNGEQVTEQCYSEMDAASIGGEALLEQFQAILAREVDDCFTVPGDSCLYLSGGIDSSFLYELVRSRECDQRLHLLVGQIVGLNQPHKIDNDYDIEYASKLAASHGQSISVVPYDMGGEGVLDDFHWLRRHLFTEYAPAFALVGLARAVPPERRILNGQNADSVLSFGSMGSPRVQGLSLSGLNGLFSRYFYFFAGENRFSPMYAIAASLRHLYYWRNFRELERDFSSRAFFLGLGLHPENKYYLKGDPAFAGVQSPHMLAEWFEAHYLEPLFKKSEGLSHHAKATLLYNKTYMQGSANRSTILSAMLQGRGIRLPYTALALLELMGQLNPDWRYAFWGKYPNMVVGRERLNLPSYIFDRCDPNDSDSTHLIYRRIGENKRFADYLHQTFMAADLTKYEGILSPSVLKSFQGIQASKKLANVPALMQLVWLESTFQHFQLV